MDRAVNYNLMSQVTSTRVLRSPSNRIRTKRFHLSPHKLIWGMSWSSLLPLLSGQLQSGNYLLSPITQYPIHKTCVSIRTPEDAVVLSPLAKTLSPLFCSYFNLSSASHLAGHGGLKKAVNDAKRYAQRNRFVIKTDIADYYASIHHFTLLDQCQHVIKDKRVMRLLRQSLNRIHVHQGIHRLIEHKSISRGCPLSPLFSALYLLPLDQLARKHNIDYVRYMDDVVFFFKKRHQLKKMLKNIYACIEGFI